MKTVTVVKQRTLHPVTRVGISYNSSIVTRAEETP